VCTSLSGGAIWGDLPVTDIVADGLWPVLMRAAEKMRRELSTDADVSEVAECVDRLLSAGLLLSFPTIDAAATAFWDVVIRPSMREGLQYGSMDAPTPASVVWQKHCAQFFARVLKAASDCRESIRNSLEQWESRLPEEWNEKISLCDYGDVSRPLDVARYLSFDVVPQTAQRPETVLSGIRTCAQRAQRLADELAVLRRLPAVLSRISRDARAGGQTITETWVGTQILLDAISAPPNAEELSFPEWEKAMTRLRNMPVKRVVERFVVRMGRRGRRFNERECDILARIVTEQWTRLCSITEISADVLLGRAFVVFSADSQVKLSEYMATGLLEGIVISKDDGSCARGEAFKSAAMRQVQWEQLRWESVELILKAGTVRGLDLAKGISRLPKELRQRAIRFCASSEMVEEDTSVFVELIRLGAFVPDAAFVSEHWRLLPIETVEATLPLLLADDHQVEIPRTTEIFLSLPQNRCRLFFTNPKHRPAAYTFVLRVLESGEISRGTFVALRERLGTEIWTRFVLAIEIHDREDIYRAKKILGHPGATLPPWEGRAESMDGSLWSTDLRKELGISQKALCALLRKYTEEDMLRWVCAGEKNEKKRIAAYLANRTRYYKR